MMQRSLKRTYRFIAPFLPWAIVGVMGLFFYQTVTRNLDDVRDISFSVTYQAVLGMLMFIVAVAVSGWLWGALLGRLSHAKISVADSVRIHSASWVLKYVPGQVGSLVNKLAWGSRRGLSKKTISTSFIYENVMMVMAGIILSLPVITIFGDAFQSNVSLFVPLLMILPFIVTFSPGLFYRSLNFAFTLMKKKPFQRSDFLSGSALARYQAGYLLPRLLNGVGFVMIVSSLLPVEPSMYIGLAATYILAGIVGLLAIFVPSGIGVREAVIVAFLSVYYPVEQAIVVAVVVRLYATVADLGVALVYLVLNKGRIAQA